MNTWQFWASALAITALFLYGYWVLMPEVFMRALFVHAALLAFAGFMATLDSQEERHRVVSSTISSSVTREEKHRLCTSPN